jgi:hypothetical protein
LISNTTTWKRMKRWYWSLLEYDVDGYTTCLGSVNDYTGAGSQGSITSWCVRKLDEAGAINLGKLSMHEFGLGTYLNIFIGISLHSALGHEMRLNLKPWYHRTLTPITDTSGNNPFKGTPTNPHNSGCKDLRILEILCPSLLIPSLSSHIITR